MPLSARVCSITGVMPVPRASGLCRIATLVAPTDLQCKAMETPEPVSDLRVDSSHSFVEASSFTEEPEQMAGISSSATKGSIASTTEEYLFKTVAQTSFSETNF